MSDEKNSRKDVVKGAPAVVSGFRIASFSERAKQPETFEPRPKKLPPSPGPVPRGRAVDPSCILNPEDDAAE